MNCQLKLMSVDQVHQD